MVEGSMLIKIFLLVSPTMAYITNLLAHTLLYKMEWQKENTAILLKGGRLFFLKPFYLVVFGWSLSLQQFFLLIDSPLQHWITRHLMNYYFIKVLIMLFYAPLVVCVFLF